MDNPVLDAIRTRFALAHTHQHVGQIVLLAKHFADDWQTLSVPRGQSEAYATTMRTRTP